MREYRMLDKPVIYVNPLCPVTTPFDIDFNRAAEEKQLHGSVGMGFGATIQRQEDNYKLFVQDLFYETVLIEKLKAIANYYGVQNPQDDIDDFVRSAKEALKVMRFATDSIIRCFTPIFEGAQGILLDQDFGFFPNVTRSNTTTKNALQLYDAKEVYYVTRSYLTRHGNGFLPDEKILPLINNENETNQNHKYQGQFRTAELNIDLLRYALTSDNSFSLDLKKNLVITCMDQYKIDVIKLLKSLDYGFDKVYISSGPSLENISLFNP